MRWQGFLLALAVAGAWGRSAAADTVRYVLAPESRLVTRCEGCDPAESRSEPLTGVFDVSILPGTDYAVEAVTGLRWSGPSTNIAGSGFLQRFADGRLAMVIDARFNGVPILLTSGRRQSSKPGEIRLHLLSPQGVRSRFAITLVAIPEVSRAPDVDGDGVSDASDNCPALATATQTDTDGDDVGDSCDACPDTSPGDPVLHDGCALAQTCPCDGPSSGEEWPNQRAYVHCVARYLKALRQEGNLGKSEIKLLLQDAVRSGCGRRVLALGG
ncbi:MAG: thrombospondin type 3 repeat-containing protein [Candidatus Binatia bacterium]